MNKTTQEATSGAESWTLDKDIAKWLAAFGTKVFKKNVWRNSSK
jgi:hypothetical protein